MIDWLHPHLQHLKFEKLVWILLYEKSFHISNICSAATQKKCNILLFHVISWAHLKKNNSICLNINHLCHLIDNYLEIKRFKCRNMLKYNFTHPMYVSQIVFNIMTTTSISNNNHILVLKGWIYVFWNIRSVLINVMFQRSMS